MAKTWAEDDPKAGLMARKRGQIVDAARKAFLDAGYAEASVNRIAATAGVSIKTLYRHYESKDELFSAVMEAACGRPLAEGETPPPPAWYALPPAEALPEAGTGYLRHVLSPEQLALYRVVVRNAHRFPDLGRRYLQATAAPRDAVFSGYLDLWAGREGWTVSDQPAAGQVFAGLLKAGLFDEVLCGAHVATAEEISRKAEGAAAAMLLLLRSGGL